jgi:hypothetical protein
LVSQSPRRALVVRLTGTGALDRSFSGDGRRLLDTGETGTGYDPEVAVDSQERVVVAATSCCSHSSGCPIHSTDPSPSPCDVTIWRLLPDGTLDTTWAKAGQKLVHNVFDFADALAVDSAGRILLGADGTGPASVMRFTQGGAMDRSFSRDGVAKIKLDGTAVSPLRLGVDSAGAITVALGNGKRDIVGAGRLTPAGTLDESYGVNGTITRRCGDRCHPSSADVDHGEVAIVVDASIRTGRGDRWLRVARIDQTGTGLDRMRVDPFPDSAETSALAVGIDGAHLVIGGRASGGGYLARLGQ